MLTKSEEAVKFAGQPVRVTPSMIVVHNKNVQQPGSVGRLEEKHYGLVVYPCSHLSGPPFCLSTDDPYAVKAAGETSVASLEADRLTIRIWDMEKSPNWQAFQRSERSSESAWQLEKPFYSRTFENEIHSFAIDETGSRLAIITKVKNTPRLYIIDTATDKVVNSNDDMTQSICDMTFLGKTKLVLNWRSAEGAVIELE